MAKKKEMSTRCKIDTSREIRQWVGTIASVVCAAGVCKEAQPIICLKSGISKIGSLVRH